MFINTQYQFQYKNVTHIVHVFNIYCYQKPPSPLKATFDDNIVISDVSTCKEGRCKKEGQTVYIKNKKINKMLLLK